MTQVHLWILVDDSYSMTDVQAPVRSALRRIFGKNYEGYVIHFITFSTQAYDGPNIDKLVYTGGSTNILDAYARLFDLALANPATPSRVVVIFVSDGIDNDKVSAAFPKATQTPPRNGVAIE